MLEISYLTRQGARSALKTPAVAKRSISPGGFLSPSTAAVRPGISKSHSASSLLNLLSSSEDSQHWPFESTTSRPIKSSPSTPLGSRSPKARISPSPSFQNLFVRVPKSNQTHETAPHTPTLSESLARSTPLDAGEKIMAARNQVLETIRTISPKTLLAQAKLLKEIKGLSKDLSESVKKLKPYGKNREAAIDRRLAQVSGNPLEQSVQVQQNWHDGIVQAQQDFKDILEASSGSFSDKANQFNAHVSSKFNDYVGSLTDLDKLRYLSKSKKYENTFSEDINGVGIFDHGSRRALRFHYDMNKQICDLLEMPPFYPAEGLKNSEKYILSGEKEAKDYTIRASSELTEATLKKLKVDRYENYLMGQIERIDVQIQGNRQLSIPEIQSKTRLKTQLEEQLKAVRKSKELPDDVIATELGIPAKIDPELVWKPPSNQNVTPDSSGNNSDFQTQGKSSASSSVRSQLPKSHSEEKPLKLPFISEDDLGKYEAARASFLLSKAEYTKSKPYEPNYETFCKKTSADCIEKSTDLENEEALQYISERQKDLHPKKTVPNSLSYAEIWADIACILNMGLQRQ